MHTDTWALFTPYCYDASANIRKHLRSIRCDYCAAYCCVSIVLVCLQYAHTCRVSAVSDTLLQLLLFVLLHCAHDQ
jgi:hypothetical protein